MSKGLDERVVEVPGFIVEVAARTGVAMIDTSAAALGSMLDTIGNELNGPPGEGSSVVPPLPPTGQSKAVAAGAAPKSYHYMPEVVAR